MPATVNMHHLLAIVKSTLRAFEDRALPILTKHCQTGIIHCDPNDQNVLTDDTGTNAIALIDYGDVCLSYYICNVAIGTSRKVFLFQH